MPDSPREHAHSSGQQQSSRNEELNTDIASAPTGQDTLAPSNNSRPPEVQVSREKVWIPRASTRTEPVARVRTKHACEACRKRRVKCDGGRPVCQGCAGTGIECVYSDHKRARDREEMKSLKSNVEKYEHLLRDLLHEVPASAAKRIKLNLTVRPLRCSNILAGSNVALHNFRGNSQRPLRKTSIRPYQFHRPRRLDRPRESTL
jgi:Fungal Zn(2)-Cys(6) binuclear cluster domain